MLKKNENIYDRVIRFMIAIVLFYLAYFKADGAVQIVLYVLALVSLVTSLTGYCYLYTILKVSTLKEKSEKKIEDTEKEL